MTRYIVKSWNGRDESTRMNRDDKSIENAAASAGLGAVDHAPLSSGSIFDGKSVFVRTVYTYKYINVFRNRRTGHGKRARIY